MADVAALEKQITEAADKVVTAKSSGASKDEVTALVGALLGLKNQLPEGHPGRPQDKKKKKKKSEGAEAPKPVRYHTRT